MWDEKEVIAYTRWLRSGITKLWLTRAENDLKARAHEIPDDTEQGAIKAHYIRKGGEIVLAFLQGQMTYEDFKRMTEGQPDPTYSAEDLVNEDLYNTMEEQTQ